MKARKRVKQSVKDGQAIGSWLVERAPHLLLSEYANRPTATPSEASKALDAAVADLRQALGAAAETEPVLAALHRLDGAIWSVAVEYEDRAFHAAWALAMGIRGGGAKMAAPRRARRSDVQVGP